MASLIGFYALVLGTCLSLIIVLISLKNFRNPENLNDSLLNEKISIFEQKLFYYKFNLLYKKILWYGTRACKKKDLPKFEILRLIKPLFFVT